MESKPICIVTGASSGVGKALYDGLKSRFSVIGVSRRGPDIEADLSRFIDERARKDFTSKLSEILKDKKVSLLVNCAGVVNEYFKFYTFAVNFWAPYYLSTELVPMVDQGMILNISSVSALMNDEEFPIYSASKAALNSITKTLAKEFAPLVRVNSLSLGFYKSNLFSGDTPQFLLDKIPLQYEEHPRSLTKLVLAMYDTKYLTGANIVVDGGLSL